MSDGQTFYAVMALLYLCSCIKPFAPQSIGVCKYFFRGWRFHAPRATLAGIKKSLFIAPLTPWAAAMVVAQPLVFEKAQQRGSLASSLRLIRLLECVSNDLRFFSMGIFILFFGVIPYFYYTEAASPRTMAAIGLSFFFIVISGLRFVGLHRRFAPDDKGERYKQLFLTLTMPWHAMRLSDELLLNPRFSAIHPLALATLTNDARGQHYLAQALRSSIYLKKPIYSEAEVRALFASLNIDAETYLSQPLAAGLDANSIYCPCCHTNYTPRVKVCADCEGTKLIHYK